MLIVRGKLGWIYHFIDYFCSSLRLGSGLNGVTTKYRAFPCFKMASQLFSEDTLGCNPKLILSAVICLWSPSSHAHFKDSFCVLNQCSKCLRLTLPVATSEF